jgi:hypothetical protein
MPEFIPVPRYRPERMTLLYLACGHQAVTSQRWQHWWACWHCTGYSTIRGACELPATCWNVPGTGEYRPLLR